MSLLNFFKNIYRYRKELYNDYEYDYTFLLVLLRRKLTLMEHFQLHNSILSNSQQYAEEIRGCIENINIYLNNEDPSSPLKKERDEIHVFLERYAKEHHLNILNLFFPNKMFGTNNKEIEPLVEKYHELNCNYYSKIEKNQKKHLNKLFDSLKLNLENWWS